MRVTRKQVMDYVRNLGACPDAIRLIRSQPENKSWSRIWATMIERELQWAVWILVRLDQDIMDDLFRMERGRCSCGGDHMLKAKIGTAYNRANTASTGVSRQFSFTQRQARAQEHNT